jgi:hypothetical protein
MTDASHPSISLLDLAIAFDHRGLLDRRSARSLPARTTTLVRRAVRELPRELRTTLKYFAPPPTRGDASAYAVALLGALDAACEIDLHDVHGSIQRVEQALTSLASSSAPALLPSFEELRGGFVAFGLRRHVNGLDGDDPARAMRIAVALAGEGLIGKQRIAYTSAFRLALEAVRVPDYSNALYLIELAHGWCPSDDEPVATYIRFHLVRIAEAAGLPDRAIDAAAPLIDRIDEPSQVFGEIASDLFQGLARAHSARGEHDLAIERAGYAAWQSIHENGHDHPDTYQAHEVLADVLFAARRVGDAIDVLERDFPQRRSHLDTEPHWTLNAGCKLVIGYARLGRRAEAVTLGRELVATAERCLPCSDPLLDNLRLVLARAEEGDM